MISFVALPERVLSLNSKCNVDQLGDVPKVGGRFKDLKPETKVYPSQKTQVYAS